MVEQERNPGPYAGQRVYKSMRSIKTDDDPDTTKEIRTIEGFDQTFKRMDIFKIDVANAEAVVERIKDYAKEKLSTFKIFENDVAYKVLILQEAERDLEFVFEVVRVWQENEFQYYAIVSKINGDLLKFKNLMAEARAYGL